MRGVRVLEAFAGPGGLSESARMVGVTGSLGVEISKDACATAEAAGHRRLPKNIRSVDPDEFTDVTGWISGPPCPTYGDSGKRTGRADYGLVLDGITELGDSQVIPISDPRHDAYEATYETVQDPRTALVLETLKFALRLPNLRWLVAEQVPAVRGIWTGMAAELAMVHDFRSCHVVRLRMDDFGSATRRTREFLLAARDRDIDLSGMPIRDWWSCGRFDPPAEQTPNPWSQFPRTTMAQALDWPSGVQVNTRGDRKTPGGNLFSADEPAVSLTGNGARTWYRTDLGSVAGRIQSDQAGILQGFPPDYPWQGSRTSQFQQVADSVSPLAGAAIVGAAAGLPWEDAAWTRLTECYGHERPAEPRPRLCTDKRAATDQLDLFAEVA
jgi:DNA (cytosine-5)-methyltransferase 1